MRRLLTGLHPVLALPILALAGCNTTGDDQTVRDLAASLEQPTAIDVTGFTVLGQDGSVNAVWTNTGGSSWTAVSPTQEQITVQEIGRTLCCISFETASDAVADFQTMQFKLTSSGMVVPIVDVVLQ
jgi:hypothetical protein